MTDKTDVPIRTSKGEQGQTIVLVAVSLFAILSMAALAIDVTTLYVASTEAQQAADAAALAGAKAFVTSGYTSYPAGFGTTNWVCNGSNGLADYAAQSALATNTVSGVVPTITTSCDFSHAENPSVTVRVQRSALPIFFARIWGASGPTASSTATAEAYNPSGGSVPTQLAGVKPWLVPNCVPGSPPDCSTPLFVNADGTISSSMAIGQTIELSVKQTAGVLSFNSVAHKYDVYPLNIPAGSGPSCPAGYSLTGNYQDNIVCFNPAYLTCSSSTYTPPAGVYGPSVNGPSDDVVLDPAIDHGGGTLNGDTDIGTQSLIHATGTGPTKGQDIFPSLSPGSPLLIQPGDHNPDVGLRSAQYISRSDSIVSVPLFDGSNLCAGATCSGVSRTTIVGFLQIAITQSVGGGIVDAIVLNASGCGSANSTTWLAGGGISPIPVRLIQTP